MRSSSTRGSGRHALAAPPATPSARPRRGSTRLVLAAAFVLGAGAIAACAAVSDAGDGEAATAAVVVPVEPGETAAAGLGREVASRSEVRAPVVRAVSVTVDGGTREVSTAGETVADVLAEAEVAVGADDVVEPSLAEPAGAAITVSRVRFVEGVDRQEIPFETTERDDASLDRGQRRVEVAGVVGVQTVYFTARVVDGHEVSREEVMRTVVAPVAQVVRVGTKVPPPPAPARTTTRSPSTGSRAASPAAPASGPVVAGDPRSIGRALAAARGWGGDQFACLDALWTKESNWNPYAQNRSSGAYGIPQALPGSKMGTVAADWRTNPATQITWGLNYIGGRYGSPCAAWAHSQARNWY